MLKIIDKLVSDIKSHYLCLYYQDDFLGSSKYSRTFKLKCSFSSSMKSSTHHLVDYWLLKPTVSPLPFWRRFAWLWSNLDLSICEQRKASVLRRLVRCRVCSFLPMPRRPSDAPPLAVLLCVCVEVLLKLEGANLG